jgi:hypothetical protein
VSSALLIVYLVGAIGTAWCLNAPTVYRDRRPFFTIPCLIWPITLMVFGVLVLIALEAYWYHIVDAASTDRRRARLPISGAIGIRYRREAHNSFGDGVKGIAKCSEPGAIDLSARSFGKVIDPGETRWDNLRRQTCRKKFAQRGHRWSLVGPRNHPRG